MKRIKQELALQKLEIAEKLFDELNFKLTFKKEIDKKSDVWKLALAAKNYATGLKDAQYSACVRMYRIFQVSKSRYPNLTEKLKEMLREVANQFFSSKKKKNSQLELGF